MSKNRNRAKFDKEVGNREYKIKLKREQYNYCYICAKRSGNFYADCSPANMHSKGVHGSGKRIFRHKFREFKTWKYNRKTKWKQ
jgi:hypothetical protein